MANRMIGSPRMIRRAEIERNEGLRQLQDDAQASNAKANMEAGVRAHLDRLRDEKAIRQAKADFDLFQAHANSLEKVETMDMERLRAFESQQYSAMANLDAEIRSLAAKEKELRLSEQLDDAKKRAVQVGVTRPDVNASQFYNGQLSHKQRQERLHAEHAARIEVMKRQREHLLVERSNIETDLSTLQTNKTTGVSHADTLNKIQMMRHSGGGHTFKAPDNSPIKVSNNASSDTQTMVAQLASRYHEDRRKLQLLREQQAQLQKEVESTKFSTWKPSVRDEPNLEHESRVDEQVKARNEFARQHHLEESKRDLSRMFKSDEHTTAAAAPAERRMPSPPRQAALGALAQHMPHSMAVHAVRPEPTGNALLDEIQQLKYDYMSRGGKDSSLLEAISALERQTFIPQSRAWAGAGGLHDVAHISGANAVQAVYSNQWSGVPSALGGPGMLGGGAPMPSPSYVHATSDFKMRSVQEEMARMDATIQERQYETKQLAQQLQLAQSEDQRNRSGDVAQRSTPIGKDGKETTSVRGRQLTEEEEELMEMEANPKDTELFRLRKKHLQEMISLKYSMQRLQQETAKNELEQQVEMMKKEHERREWVLKQQQQLLEAKYRKHMAREKPLMNVGGQSENNKPKDNNYYSPDVGFNMYVDYVLGLPSKVSNQVQVVYGFYEGMSAKTDAKSLPLSGVENDGAGLRSVIAVKRAFLKVAANDKFKVIMELQSVIPATVDRGPRTMPVGWTMLRLFEEEGNFNRGLWRVPMFLPPVRPDLVPEDLVNLHRISNLEVFMRLIPGQQSDVHDRFSINPDMTQMQYKYPKELKPIPKEPEKRLEAATLDQPPVVPTLALPWQMKASDISPTQGVVQSVVAASVDIAQVVAGQVLPGMTEMQIQLHHLSGTLFGHSHCQEPGPVFVRISIILLSTGQLVNTRIGPHVNAAVPSAGLRVIERIIDEDGNEGEEQEVSKQVQGSWCTPGVLAQEGLLVNLGQGCMFECVPCNADTGLLLELYREYQGPADAPRTVSALRQYPDLDSTLIAWASIPLFSRSGMNDEVLGEGEQQSEWERSEWSKAGLRILEGVQEKPLLAPPITSGADYDSVRLKQSKFADVMSCDGLATSSGGVTVILNAPLPTLHFTIDATMMKKNKWSKLKNTLGAVHVFGKKGPVKADSIFKSTDKEAWMASPDPRITNELFALDDGFDIYIDGARFLPDNVSLTHVTCFVANSQMQIYAKFEKEVDVRSMNIRCPYFLARKEMRKDPSKDWDATMTLLIQMNGIEGNPFDLVKRYSQAKQEGANANADASATPTLTLPCVVVGFAVLNIFLDPVTTAQPRDINVREYVLNEGSFQLALYRSGLKRDVSGVVEDLSVRALDDEMRRLCTTVLVRLAKAPRSEDGTKVMSIKDHPGVAEDELQVLKILWRPQPYASQGYSSSNWSSPLEMEKVLYPHRLNSQKAKTISAAQVLLGILGQKLTPEDEMDINQCEMFLPENCSDLLKTMRGHMKQLFRTNIATSVLDTRLSIPYMVDQGFLLSVDGIDNMTQDYFAVWTGAFSSTLPQAMLYKSEGEIASDVTIFYQLDFQADARSPRWSDGWMWYRQREASRGSLVAIIDVRMVVTEAKVGRKMKKLKNPQVVQLGFAFLPIIGPAGNYVLSGNYRIPLFAMGAKPQPLQLDHADQLKSAPLGPSAKVLEHIELLEPGEDMKKAVGAAMKEGEMHLVEGSSVVCRLVDRSRYGEFSQGWIVDAGPTRIDTSYLPAGLESKYKVTAAKEPLMHKLKTTVASFTTQNSRMLDLMKKELKLPASIEQRPASPRRSVESAEVLAQAAVDSPGKTIAQSTFRSEVPLATNSGTARGAGAPLPPKSRQMTARAPQ